MQTVLTKENAHLVATVISIKNPEWGSKRFNHNEQPLPDNRFASVIGIGANSSVLFEDEYKFWYVNSWK